MSTDIMRSDSQPFEQSLPLEEQKLKMERREDGEMALFDTYKDIVRPGRSVVVIGPSASIYLDATSVLAAYLLGPDGKLFMADPNSQNFSYREEMEKKVGGVVTGIGDVHRYMREMASAKSCGMVLANPVWLGGESGAQHIPVEDSSLDVVVDHNTSVFLAGIPSLPHYSDALLREVLLSCFREYARVLRQDGDIIIQTNNTKYKLINKATGKSVVLQILEKCGFYVTQRQTQDIVMIPIEENVADQLKKQQFVNCGDNTGYFLGSRVVERGDKYFIRFDKQDHYSEDLYLAKRVI
jgi:SAM-dependent methyltransferase